MPGLGGLGGAEDIMPAVGVKFEVRVSDYNDETGKQPRGRIDGVLICPGISRSMFGRSLVVQRLTTPPLGSSIVRVVWPSPVFSFKSTIWLSGNENETTIPENYCCSTCLLLHLRTCHTYLLTEVGMYLGTSTGIDQRKWRTVNTYLGHDFVHQPS